MKWLIIFFSILKPLFSPGDSSSMKDPIAELKDMIKANTVKYFFLFMFASAMASMFAAGVVLVAIDIGAQYDQNAYVYFSSMITMGLTLMLIPIFSGALGIKIFQSNVRQEREREVLTSVGTSHPLQDAIALLVNDFVKERELKRAAKDTKYQDPSFMQASSESSNQDEPRH